MINKTFEDRYGFLYANYVPAFYYWETVELLNAWDHEIAPGRFAARPPAETVSRLNHVFLSDLETEHYFTIALADVDLATGRVILAQAGHPHPAVQRADGSVEFVGEGGLPVGLIEGASFDQGEELCRLLLNKYSKLKRVMPYKGSLSDSWFRTRFGPAL